MMMTHPYYGGNDFDVFHRSTHRTMSNGSYYDRVGPYSGHFEPHAGLRQEYPGRVSMHAMINEPEQPDVAGGPPRRRIAVACARCRRRKIKCSGDPGDGSGCNACKTSGANTQDCNFTRVSSYTLPFKGTPVDMLPPVSTSNLPASTTHFNIEPSSATSSTFPPAPYLGYQRPLLPTLHTPASYGASEYEQPYDNSPVEAYTYGSTTIPRQDSYSSSYGSQESYRSFSAAPLSAPASAPFYEHGTYSFGNLQSPAPGRLPSVTAETMSSLNMDSLHSTLPLNTATERTLPAPYTISYPTHTWSSQPRPDLRPLDMPKFRPHINGIHSRSAMGWSPDGIPTRNSSIAPQQQTVLPPPQRQQQQQQHQYQQTSHQLPTCPFPNTSPTSSAQDTSNSAQILGYQFAPSACYSPDVSPTTAPDGYPASTPTSSSTALPPSSTTVPASASSSSSESANPTTLPPPHHSLRYPSSSASLPTQTAPHYSPAPTSRHHEAATSLYSFSTENSVAIAGSGDGQPQQQQQQQQRPHHAASHDGLRQQSQGGGEFEARRRPGHRSSARSLRERRDV